MDDISTSVVSRIICRMMIIVLIIDQASEAAWERDGRDSPYKVVGGVEGHTVYYVCAVGLDGHRMCGKISALGSGCTVTWNDQPYVMTENVDVLVAQPHTEFRYEWSTEKFHGGSVPANAINCSYDSYVGRKREEADWYLGKIDTINGYLFYARGDLEIQSDTYHVLVQVPRVKHD